MSEERIKHFIKLDIPHYWTLHNLIFAKQEISKGELRGMIINNYKELNDLWEANKVVHGIIISKDYKYMLENREAGYWTQNIINLVGETSPRYLGFESSYKMADRLDMLTSGIVDLGPDFDQKIPDNIFWRRTYVLVLYGKFKQEFKTITQFPLNLRHLILGSDYPHPIDTSILPTTLQEIVYLDKKDNDIVIKARITKKEMDKYETIYCMKCINPKEKNPDSTSKETGCVIM